MGNIFDNFIDKDELQLSLIFISVFIATFESFSDRISDNVKSFLCNDIRFEEDEVIYIENDVFRREIKNRKVDESGNKDILKSSFLWLVGSGCFTDNDYKDFLSLKKKRNQFVHEGLDIIITGIFKRDLDLLVRLLEIYSIFDKWWINEIEIPISGEDIPDDYDKDQVFSVTKMLISVLVQSGLFNEKIDIPDQQ